jgi:hypothetical protein
VILQFDLQTPWNTNYRTVRCVKHNYHTRIQDLKGTQVSRDTHTPALTLYIMYVDFIACSQLVQTETNVKYTPAPSVEHAAFSHRLNRCENMRWYFLICKFILMFAIIYQSRNTRHYHRNRKHKVPTCIASFGKEAHAQTTVNNNARCQCHFG